MSKREFQKSSNSFSLGVIPMIPPPDHLMVNLSGQISRLKSVTLVRHRVGPGVSCQGDPLRMLCGAPVLMHCALWECILSLRRVHWGVCCTWWYIQGHCRHMPQVDMWYLIQGCIIISIRGKEMVRRKKRKIIHSWDGTLDFHMCCFPPQGRP